MSTTRATNRASLRTLVTGGAGYIGSHACKALRDAGFQDVAFHNMTLAPDSQVGDEGDYWDHWLKYPFFIMIDGIKA